MKRATGRGDSWGSTAIESAEHPDVPTTRDLLVGILSTLQKILVALEAPRPASALSRADRETLTRLLPAIAGTLGSELFLVAEIYEHPSTALRIARGDLSPKALGRLLQRATGCPVGGYLVQDEGTEAGARLRRVLQVVE